MRMKELLGLGSWSIESTKTGISTGCSGTAWITADTDPQSLIDEIYAWHKGEEPFCAEYRQYQKVGRRIDRVLVKRVDGLVPSEKVKNETSGS